MKYYLIDYYTKADVIVSGDGFIFSEHPINIGDKLVLDVDDKYLIHFVILEREFVFVSHDNKYFNLYIQGE